MTVADLRRGERAVVIRVALDEELRARLAFLRVFAGAKISMLKVSLFKKTFLIQAGTATIALERGAAEGILVWKT